MQLARQILDLPSALRVLSPRTLPYPALADLGVDLGNAPSDTQAPGDAQEPGEPVTAEPGLRDLARMVERLEYLSQQQHDLMLRPARRWHRTRGHWSRLVPDGLCGLIHWYR